MKNLIKDAVILFTITLIAGLFLGFVFEFTKEDRALQAEKKKNNAYSSFLKATWVTNPFKFQALASTKPNG